MPVRVFWGLVFGFVAGVAVRSFFAVGLSFVLFLFLIAVVVLVASRKVSAVWQSAIVVAVFLAASALGVVRTDGAQVVGDAQLDARIGQRITLDGIVVQEPDVREGTIRLAIAVQSLASSSESVHAGVMVVVPAFTEVSYGDRVRVSGTLKLPEAFDSGSGRAFDYPGFLAAQAMEYQLDFAHIDRDEGFYGNVVVRSAINIKHVFVRGLEQSLTDPQAGLAAGITVGDKRSLGKELTDAFRRVSLVHVIVLSGYNITIMIAGVFLLFSRFPRVVRFGAGVVIAVFFAIMTGFAAASFRAAVMAIITISGSLSGRLYAADRALGLVAAGMLMWNPLLLRYDPGFQLSFVATAGLMLVSPVIASKIQWIRSAAMREIIAATVSAQIAVLPLLLYSSGTLSLVALPANFLVLAVVPAAMLTSALASVGGWIAGPLAPIIGFPAYVLLSYMIGVAHLLASMPFSSTQIPAFNGWWLVPVYGALVGGAIYLRHGETARQ